MTAFPTRPLDAAYNPDVPRPPLTIVWAAAEFGLDGVLLSRAGEPVARASSSTPNWLLWDLMGLNPLHPEHGNQDRQKQVLEHLGLDEFPLNADELPIPSYRLGSEPAWLTIAHELWRTQH